MEAGPGVGLVNLQSKDGFPVPTGRLPKLEQKRLSQLQLQSWQHGSKERQPISRGDVRDFVTENELESWIGDALMQLSETQRNSVMPQPLRIKHIGSTREIIVLSRIRDVSSLPQRVAVFRLINNVSKTLLAKLSTQSPAVQDEVMQWPRCKLVRVSNPDGVVTKRLGDAVKTATRSRSAAPARGRHACDHHAFRAQDSAHSSDEAPITTQGSHSAHGAQQDQVERLTFELLDALSRARRAEESLATLRSEVDELLRANEALSEACKKNKMHVDAA